MKELPALNFDDVTPLPDLDFLQELPELFPKEQDFSFVQGKKPSFLEKTKNKITDLFAPPDPGLGPLTQEDFEAFKPADVAPKLTRTEEAIKEGMFEGFVKPTLKAIPRVTGTIAGTMAAAPGAGVEAAAQLLPRVPADPNTPWYKLEPGNIKEAEETLNKRLGAMNFIKTPEEAEAIENIGLATKPFVMAGEGWGMIGQAINDALKDPNMPQDEDPIPFLEPYLASIGEASAVFGVFGVSGAKGVLNKIKNSTTYRRLTIPERKLVVQDLAETMQKNPQMTEGEILRKYNNPQWKAEALKARLKTESDLPPLFGDKTAPGKGVVPPIGEPTPEPMIKFMGHQDILKTGDFQPIFEIVSSPDPGKWAVGSTLTLRGLKEQGLNPPEFPPPPEGKKEPYSYDGDGYKVTEIKTSDIDAKTKWQIDISPDRLIPLKGLVDQVRSGEAGGKMQVGEGPEKEWIGYSSTYLEFMKNRFAAKETITALQKALEGKPLGIRQAEIVESALEYINEEMYYNERKALEDDGIEGTEIEGIQREGKSEASEEFARQMEAEFAELERRAKQESDQSAKSIIDDWADFFDSVRSGKEPFTSSPPELFPEEKIAAVETIKPYENVKTIDGVRIIDIDSVSKTDKGFKVASILPEMKTPNLFDTKKTDIVNAKKLGRSYYDFLIKKPVSSPAFSGEKVSFTERGYSHITGKEDRALTDDNIKRRLKLLPKALTILQNTPFVDEIRINPKTGNKEYSLLGRFKDGSVTRVVVEAEENNGKIFYSVYDLADISKKLKRAPLSDSSSNIPGHGVDKAPSGHVDKDIISNESPGVKTQNKDKGDAGLSGDSAETEFSSTGNQKTPETYSDTGGYATNVKSILQLPEIVWLAKELSGGKYPKIRELLRKRGARGTFTPGRGEIALKADIFKNPDEAAAVLAHEIGHLVDWLPDHVISRGNILGRIASLKKYLKHSLPNAPGTPGALTAKDRNRLRYLAEKLAAKENDKWIDEVITKEMPVSPEDVLAIWNDVEQAKLINPELYDYVARLSTPEKKSIVKEAMKGISPAQLKNFTKTITEKTGKRIKQKMYDEIDGKKTPQEWFKQKIREKYAELINKEIEKRRLFDLDEIKNELKALSRAWKPFDPAADAEFTAYRYSGPELYADAFSALLNAPGLLKSIAPKYYETFFNYMEKKPEVKRLYEEIQDSINSGSVQKKRVENLKRMFRQGDDAYATSLEKADRKISDMAMRDLIDANHAILQKVRMVGERNVPAGENPRYRLEEMAYSGSEAELYIQTIAHDVLKPLEDAGLDWDTLGEYMYHLRVSTERAEMANPQGWTAELSTERIKEIERTIGPEKFKALENARKAFRKLRENNFIKKAEEAEVYSKELMNKIKDTENYATFDVIDYIEKRYGRGSGAKIHKQIGTLNEVSNPATATIMKDISLIKSINKQLAARSVVEFLEKHFPGEISPADKKWNGKFLAIADPPPGSDQGLIVILRNGEAKGYYVDKWIAESFEANPYESQFIAKLLSKTVQPFRLVFTELNYGFWLFNIFRDYQRAVKLLPGNSLVKFAKYYASGIKLAFKSVYGIPDQVVSEMQKGNMLISVADVRGLRPEDTQLERLLAMYRVKPGKWETGIRKPFGKAFNYFTNIGRGFERATKVASYKYLLDKFPDMDPHEAGHIVRTMGGSPDFLRLGRGYPIYNNLLMFSNAMKEGYRGDYEAFTKRPGEFIWKQAKYTWIPKLLMKAAAIGLMGGTIKAIFDGVSEYDKTNYQIIPLGLTKNGKSVYLRVPLDETSRFIGGIFWKLISGDIDDMTTGLFDYMAGQAPTVNPSIDMLTAAVEYAAGQNPYDHFRGRNAIPEQIFEAGGARKHEAFLKWMTQQAGAGIVYRFENDDVDKVKGELEKVLGYPILSNAVGRFIKVSNTGIREDLREAKKEIRSENTRELLDAKDALNKMVSGEKLNDEDIQAILKKPDIIDRNTAVALARKYGNVYLEELMTAQSNEEKAAVLNKLFEREMLLRRDKDEGQK